MTHIWSTFQAAIVVLCIFRTTSACAQLPLPSSQPLPSFEVATIRPSQSENGGTSFEVAPMRLRIQNATVSELIHFAYDIRSESQLQNEPHWSSVAKFDVDAKIDDMQAATIEKLAPSQQINQYRLMLQTLLNERFALRVHTQSEELSVFALEVAKGGPKLTSAAEPLNLPNLSGWSRGSVDAHAATMSDLSEGLSGKDDVGGRIVIDATGLKGTYDFTLHWTPAANRALDATSSDAAGVPISTALREQLGLKLTSRKTPAIVLVVDHVEHPSPN